MLPKQKFELLSGVETPKIDPWAAKVALVGLYFSLPRGQGLSGGFAAQGF
jgi:hypothetical protein